MIQLGVVSPEAPAGMPEKFVDDGDVHQLGELDGFAEGLVCFLLSGFVGTEDFSVAAESADEEPF